MGYHFSKHHKSKSDALLSVERHEIETGINTLDRWLRFANETELHAKNLKAIISENANKILAYGASARSSTLLNFCQISSDHIFAIIDKNPLKHGLITPGSNIPIISFEDGLEQIQQVETILLLAWNFQDEVIEELKTKSYSGKFIVPLPRKTYIK